MTTAARTGLPESSAPEAAEATRAEKPASRQRLVLGAVAALVVVVGAGWYVVHRGLENTDDAQVDGDVVAVPARMGGIVAHVHFTENQQVKAGDLLVELEDAP